MKFFRSFFKKESQPIQSNSDFWDWFVVHQKKFYRVVKYKGPVNRIFFHPLSEKLNELKEGFWFLVGMCDENKAELIITADGVVKNLVFAEELVGAAPKMSNWKITALKQPNDIKNVCIEMQGFVFDQSTIQFYPKIHKSMPDIIDITLAHKNFSEKDSSVITNGTFLTLDHYLGELNSVTSIDNITIINPKDAEEELIPFERLKSYLIWREKEFIDKYENLRWNSGSDKFISLKGKLKNGLPLVAVVNNRVLDWKYQTSHPWIAEIEFHYDGTNNDGMPDEEAFQSMKNIEDKINKLLTVQDGFIYIGSETADSLRLIYYACIEFRSPSKALHEIRQSCSETLKMEYEIFKDKYWQCLKRFKSKF
jgi:hypothetical protein